MSFLNNIGKFAGNMGSVLGGTLAPPTNKQKEQDQLKSDQLIAQIRTRDKKIRQLEMQVKKLNQDNDFINKAFEDLEIENQQTKETYKQFEKTISHHLQQFTAVTNKLQTSLKTQIETEIINKLQTAIGEPVEQDAMVDWNIRIDCSDFLRAQYKCIMDSLKQQLGSGSKKTIQGLMVLQQQSKINQQKLREDTTKLQSLLKQRQSQFQQALALKQQEMSTQLLQAKQQQQTIVGQLKAMLGKEKQNGTKMEKQLNTCKIAQEKYQKQIYVKCEENNQLVLKNKELGAAVEKIKGEVTLLKAELEKQKQKEKDQDMGQDLLGLGDGKDSTATETKQLQKMRKNMKNLSKDISDLKEQFSQMNPYLKSIFSQLNSDMHISCQKTWEELETNTKAQTDKYESIINESMRIMQQQIGTFCEAVQKVNEDVVDKIGQHQNRVCRLFVGMQRLVQRNQKLSVQLRQVNAKIEENAQQHEKQRIEWQQRLQQKQQDHASIIQKLTQTQTQIIEQHKQTQANLQQRIEELSTDLSSERQNKQEMSNILNFHITNAQQNQSRMADLLRTVGELQETRNTLMGKLQNQHQPSEAQKQQEKQQEEKQEEKEEKQEKMEKQEKQEIIEGGETGRVSERIQELQKEVERLEHDLKELTQTLRIERQTSNQKIQQLQASRLVTETQAQAASSIQKSEELAEKERQIMDLQNKIKESATKLSEQSSQLQSLQGKQIVLETIVSTLKETIQTQSSTIDQLQQQISQLKATQQSQVSGQAVPASNQSSGKEHVDVEVQTQAQVQAQIQEQVQIQVQGELSAQTSAQAQAQEELRMAKQQCQLQVMQIQEELVTRLAEKEHLLTQLTNMENVVNQLQNRCQLKDKQCEELKQTLQFCNKQLTAKVQQLTELSHKHNQLQTKYTAISTTLSISSQQISSLTLSLSQQIQTTTQLQIFLQESQTRTQQISGMEQQKKGLYDKLKQTEGQKEILEGRVAQFESKEVELQSRIAGLEQQKKIVEGKLIQLQKENDELKGDIEMMKEMSSSMDQQYLQLVKSQELNKQYQVIQKEFQNIFKSELGLDNFLKIDEEREEMKNKLKDLTIVQEKLNSQIHILTEQNEKLEASLLQKNAQIEKKKKKIRDLVQKVEEESASNAKMQTVVQQLKSKLDKLEKSKADIESESIQLRKQLTKEKLISEEARKTIEEKQKDISEKEKQITVLKSKRTQLQETSKKQLQSWKNKCNKLETQNSQVFSSNKELKEKILKCETTINELRKGETDMKKQKDLFAQNEVIHQQEIIKLRTEVERVVIQTTEKIKREKAAAQKELADREEGYKNDKLVIERRYGQEIQKLKNQLKAKDKKIQDAQNQVKTVKNKLTEEKKMSAMLNGKIQEIKGDYTKMEAVEAQILELKKQLLMKEEDLKRSFNKSKNLQSTIEQLQSGIDSCQAYALEKSQQIQQVNNRLAETQAKLAQLKSENEKLRQKCSFQIQLDEVNNFDSSQKQLQKMDRKEIILPIKRLVLKYFEASATYEQKVNILHTLSQVLELDRKESEILKGYRKTKLSSFEMDQKGKEKEKKQPGIQNKFFDFLTSDN